MGQIELGNIFNLEVFFQPIQCTIVFYPASGIDDKKRLNWQQIVLSCWFLKVLLFFFFLILCIWVWMWRSEDYRKYFTSMWISTCKLRSSGFLVSSPTELWADWWDTSVVPTLRGWKSISIEFHISLRKQDLVFKIKLKTKTYPRCSGCTPVIPIPGNQEDQSSGHHPPLQGKFQANPGDPGWKQSFFWSQV